jgi:hypothetical protein
MLVAFLVCLLGMALLWVTLVQFELGSKSASADLGRLRRALDPGDAPAPAGRIAPAVPAAQAQMQAGAPEHGPGRRT